MNEFVDLFLENLYSLLTDTVCELAPEVLATITIFGGTATLSAGFDMMDHENIAVNTLGTAVSAFGSSVTTAANDAASQVSAMELTQSYVETMNEVELEEMIAKLEAVDTEVLVKKL